MDNPELYTWVTAALFIERAAATAVFGERHDEHHDEIQGFLQHSSDTNSYTRGRMVE